MRLDWLGEEALILRELDVPPYELAAALNASPPVGLKEAVASYETVGLFIDPERFDPVDLILPSTASIQPRKHEIPVCYEMGEDLAEVAGETGLPEKEVIKLHSGSSYRCYAIGFCPGFPYLGYLPEKLAGLSRKPSPRVRVPPGSVGLTGNQTGIYPLERPGGWRLIGRTPLTIVDVADAYFPIQAGDEVRFRPISASEYEARLGERL